MNARGMIGLLSSLLFFGFLQAQSPNLIVNGDFEDGPMGFYTEYIYDDYVNDHSEYWVGDNPRKVHGGFKTFGDHSSGNGLCMVVNGSSSTTRVVWGQTLSVDTGTTYRFSMWTSAACCWDNPAELRVEINGVAAGPIHLVDQVSGTWEQAEYDWHSGSDTMAVIRIRDMEPYHGGDDFCLDDLSFVGLEGCHEPYFLSANVHRADSVRLQWSSIPDAQRYELRGQRIGAPGWAHRSTTATAKWIAQDFAPGQAYDWQVRSLCAEDTSAWAAPKRFQAVDDTPFVLLRTMGKISQTEGGFGGSLSNDGNFGFGLSTIGDLDGDGIPEAAIGNRRDDDGGSNRGAVWILFLNPDGSVRREQKISDTQGGFTGVLGNEDYFGVGMDGIGDLDGDGIPDLAVGAYYDDDGGSNRGAVYILFLKADGTVKAHQKISHTAGGLSPVLGNDDRFGVSVAGVGDLNGDGMPELAVGAYADDDGGENAGAVYLLSLHSDGTVASGQKISTVHGGFEGLLAPFDYFGEEVDGLGDLDGDGIGDLVVGASGADDGGTKRGAVWILFMNADGTVRNEAKISAETPGMEEALNDGDAFRSVASVPDLNGDGHRDLCVGAPLHDLGRGAFWILYLAADGSALGAFEVGRNHGGFGGRIEPDDRFGGRLAHAGDIDGDGQPELLVGAFQDDDGGSNPGAVYLLSLRAEQDPNCVFGLQVDSIQATETSSISCSGILTAFASGGVPPYQFAWSDPMAQSTATASALCPGGYLVTVTDSLGCSVSAYATVLNDPCPTPDAPVLQSLDMPVAYLAWPSAPEATQYRLYVRPLGEPHTAFLQFDTVQAMIVTPMTTYEAVMRMLCADTSSPYSDALVFATPASRTSAVSWGLQPNPTQGILHVQVSGWNRPYRVQIVDAFGRIRLEKSLEDPTLTLHLEHLPSGMYFAVLHLEDEKKVQPFFRE